METPSKTKALYTNIILQYYLTCLEKPVIFRGNLAGRGIAQPVTSYTKKGEKMKEEIVKIRTKEGRIITLTISKRTDTHITGIDKFNQPVILPLIEIDKMMPYVQEEKDDWIIRKRKRNNRITKTNR